MAHRGLRTEPPSGLTLTERKAKLLPKKNVLVCVSTGRPLRAFLQRRAHQQHLRVSVLDADGRHLRARLHVGPMVPAEEAGLGPPNVGQTALHGPSHLPQW